MRSRLRKSKKLERFHNRLNEIDDYTWWLKYDASKKTKRKRQIEKCFMKRWV